MLGNLPAAGRTVLTRTESFYGLVEVRLIRPCSMELCIRFVVVFLAEDNRARDAGDPADHDVGEAAMPKMRGSRLMRMLLP